MKFAKTLACDESTGTIGTRLELIGIENAEANGAEWYILLFTTKGLSEFISDAIMFEVMLYLDAQCSGKLDDVVKGDTYRPCS